MAEEKITIEWLAKRIHQEVYSRFYTYKTAVFLCGAGSDAKNSVREQINNALLSEWYSYRYDIFRPEDLFGELMSGPHHQDLIALENMLADSVDAVVLAVESWGAVAELGSFASNPRLRKKMVCLVDRQYKKSRSFINRGPLRLLKDRKEGEVLYIDFSDAASDIDRVREAIARVRKHGSKSAALASVVQAHHFVLSCIYLTEPVARGGLVLLVRHASGADEKRAEDLTAGALAVLNKNREVHVTAEGYRLSKDGLARFAVLGRRGRAGQTVNVKAMDALRVAILNRQRQIRPLFIQ
jgi:hypothetical protein